MPTFPSPLLRLISNPVSSLVFILFPTLTVLACGAGAAGTRRVDPPMTLQGLETLCRLPAPCGVILPCAGRTVTIAGTVDPRNIFSQQTAPRLPYEKFRLEDQEGRAVEVWAQAPDNTPIFEKLARRPSDRIQVTGRIVPFDMPITGACVQGLKVVITHANQIQFN